MLQFWGVCSDSPAQTCSSERCGAGTVHGEVDGTISQAKRGRQRGQDSCVYDAADGLPAQKFYVQVSLESRICCGVIYQMLWPPLAALTGPSHSTNLWKEHLKEYILTSFFARSRSLIKYIVHAKYASFIKKQQVVVVFSRVRVTTFDH